MKILFLDDDLQRHEHFSRYSIGHNVWHARTVQAAIKWLEKAGPFDVLCLDHDLTGQMIPEPCGDSQGCAVVAYLVKNKGTALRSMIRVHSYNKTSAEKMVADLTANGLFAVWVPFGGWFPNKNEG